jgi:uncharacterized protein (TIGR04222 family)
VRCRERLPLNPFDLRGPEFLVFYSLLCLATAVVVVLLRRRAEGGPMMKVRLTDPYAIAYLRGGTAEAIRVASVSLVDRDLLRSTGADLAGGRESAELARKPLEKALIEQFSLFERPALEALSDSAVVAAAEGLAPPLVRDGLLPDDEIKRRRLGRTFLAVAFVWAVALVKLYVAAGRGRHNVGFLVALAGLGAPLLLYAASNPRRTVRGDALLADLKSLFAGLKERAGSLRRGGATAEAAMLAAVFGVAALPQQEWSYVRDMYPKARASSNCGSSCGSSCGSGCGGGGCGGGCGGCGS